MVSAVAKAFEAHYEDIMTGAWPHALVKKSKASVLCKALKDFDTEYGYKHRGVLEIELKGFNILQDIMDMIWKAITQREVSKDLGSERTTPFAKYVYFRISENYRRFFEGKQPFNESKMPIRYREIQLLTDMIAGMADGFAVDLHEELSKFHVGASAK